MKRNILIGEKKKKADYLKHQKRSESLVIGGNFIPGPKDSL